jgi:hypothetical protein
MGKRLAFFLDQSDQEGAMRLGGGLLPGDFGALLPRLRKSDRDCLFAAGYLAASAALSRAESPALFAVHGAFNALARRFAVSSHHASPCA